MHFCHCWTSFIGLIALAGVKLKGFGALVARACASALVLARAEISRSRRSFYSQLKDEPSIVAKGLVCPFAIQTARPLGRAKLLTLLTGYTDKTNARRNA